MRHLAFTRAEQHWAADDAARYAVLWAAKEATAKAVGQGFDELSWLDVRVDVDRSVVWAGSPERWRLTLMRRDDHVVAVSSHESAHALRVALAPAVRTPLSYVERSRRARKLAEHLLGQVTSIESVRWGSTDAGAPLLDVAGVQVPVSLTHGDGLCAAALQTGRHENDRRTCRSSAIVTV